MHLCMAMRRVKASIYKVHFPYLQDLYFFLSMPMLLYSFTLVSCLVAFNEANDRPLNVGSTEVGPL